MYTWCDECCSIWTTSAVSRRTLHTNATKPSNLRSLSISSRAGPRPDDAERLAACVRCCVRICNYLLVKQVN